MGGGTGRRRAAVTALLLLALLAVVGLASRAHTAGGGGSARVLDSDILLEYTLLLIAAAGVVVIPLTVYAFVVGRQDEEIALPPRRNWMLAVLLTMTAIAVVSVVLLAGGYLRHHHGTSSSAPLTPLLNLAGKGTRAPRAVAFDWVPVIVVSALAVAALGAGGLLVARRRRPSRAPGIAGALVLALDETLDDLRCDLDPRTAVIAAYAQMERVLARFGLPRSPSEAPREYLGRVLPGVGAGAVSIERLTDLYERARFSTQTIDGGMKAEAIAALETVRDELRSAA
jgi:Domain of unknown function (DUF4129)